MNAPNSQWRRGEWYIGMRMDWRLDTVFSTRDEQIHADLKAKESGGVSVLDASQCRCANDVSTMGETSILSSPMSTPEFMICAI